MTRGYPHRAHVSVEAIGTAVDQGLTRQRARTITVYCETGGFNLEREHLRVHAVRYRDALVLAA
jgi:hypothetical protein